MRGKSGINAFIDMGDQFINLTPEHRAISALWTIAAKAMASEPA